MDGGVSRPEPGLRRAGCRGEEPARDDARALGGSPVPAGDLGQIRESLPLRFQSWLQENKSS